MDNLDRLNAKLRARERIFGYTVYMPDQYVLGEYMPDGVDFILFDCEHGPYDIDHYAPYFRLCREKGIPTITRVPDATYPHISHVADLGCDGIMVPRVESLEQVKTAVEGLYLPPDGKKGFGGKWQFYPGETIEEYRRRRMIWIQIESRKGAELLPEILKQYGAYISACIIGPMDLSINLGTPLEIWTDEAAEVVQSVFSQCEAAGITSGIYANNEADAARRVAQGANLLWVTCDAFYLTRAIAQVAQTIKNL